MKAKFEIKLPSVGADINVEVEYSISEVREMVKLYREVLSELPEIMEDVTRSFDKFNEIEKRYAKEEEYLERMDKAEKTTEASIDFFKSIIRSDNQKKKESRWTQEDMDMLKKHYK